MTPPKTREHRSRDDQIPLPRQCVMLGGWDLKKNRGNFNKVRESKHNDQYTLDKLLCDPKPVEKKIQHGSSARD
jgi:hypothetical protein